MAPPPKTRIRWLAMAATTLGVAALVWFGLARVHIDADILNALPTDDPVLEDAHYVFKHHPGLDRIAVDLTMPGNVADRDALADAADLLTPILQESGHFRRVGNDGLANGAAHLLSTAAANLPVLFQQEELESRLAEALEPARLDKVVGRIIEQLSGLEGIGQADLLMRDPLQLRMAVLERLGGLLPSSDAVLYRGHLVSGDGSHLLLVAECAEAGTDTLFARQLDETFRYALSALANAPGATGQVIATPVGAYRAALDNENAAREDTAWAVTLAGLLIVALLLLFFPRRWLGILAVVPALAGTAAGLVIYSFLQPSISLLALGFGGAIVSISVDHGLAYLLFLDRRAGSTGKAAAHEVRSVGLLATLTTVGAFLSLQYSGLPILAQLGLFAGLGISCSFLFVHAIFPWIFPAMGPQTSPGWIDVERVARWLTQGGDRIRLIAAVSLVVGLGLLARPEFSADLSKMNSVGPETLAAEQLVTDVWGDVMGRLAILVEGNDRSELQDRADALASLLDQQVNAGTVERGFSPSLVVPGSLRGKANFAAWRAFWTTDRVSLLRRELGQAAHRHGFTADAFEPFLEMVTATSWVTPELTADMNGILGISNGESGHVAIGAVTPGSDFDADAFFELASALPGVHVLAPELFGQHLSEMLFHTFGRMLLFIGAGVIVALFLFFLDALLVLVVLAPLAFALVCTLGTLHLLGRPVDIPGLLLAVVILGMGIDYSIYFVRGYQRYGGDEAADFAPIRGAVVLAWLSTLAGFGTLAISRHVLLESAGTSGFVAVGFTGLGTFLLLPPLLRRVFAMRPESSSSFSPGSREHYKNTLCRYLHAIPYARQFARFKMLLDPMFPRLAEYIRPNDRVLDIGCGFGVPGAWLLALWPDIHLWGIEPDLERVLVTRNAWGARGTVLLGAAPELPIVPGEVDVVLLLDMAHYLDDQSLGQTLARIRPHMANPGRLVMRSTVPSNKRWAWERGMERVRCTLLRWERPIFRTPNELRAILEEHGFAVVLIEESARGREETWVIANTNADDEDCTKGS